MREINIARGTTDPGYWLYSLNYFSDGNQFKDGVTCIGSKFCHLYFFWICTFWFVANWFKIWSSGDVTCIAWFQSWPPGCVTCVATLPWIALSALSVSIELVSSAARVTSVKSATRSLTQWETTGPIDRTPETPGSDKKRSTWNSIGKYKRNKKHSKWKCNIKVSKWNWSLTKIQNKMKRHLVYERDLKFQNQNVIGQ